MKRLLLILISLTALSANVMAGNLYKVAVNNPQEAEIIKSAGVQPVLRLNDGYLILADGRAAEIMQINGISVESLASGVDPDRLFLDHRPDRANVKRFNLVYESGDLRLFQVERSLALSIEGQELIPIDYTHLKIEYTPQKELYLNASFGDIDLPTLIAGIEMDSLTAYTERLQAFLERVTGTDSCYAARDWIKGKFEDFGYDSVVLDNFAGLQLPSPTTEVAAYNVVAYKVGSLYPDRQIVIGGHYDAVPDCPGADDNGSGTAAVMEIARALKDTETDMTVVFIAFDSEESGLHGSHHYADAAVDRGDSIILMVNLDMIGYIDNDLQAKLYNGPVQAYSQLWAQLANDPALGIGISGILMGQTGASDHVPFVQNEYDVTFVHEFNFNTYYHTPNDVTENMNFDYMTRIIKASLATAYVTNNAPLPVTITSVRDGGDGQSMQVEWTRPEPGRIANYIVNYDQLTPYLLPLADTISGDSSRWMVTGLMESEQYQFYVIAVDYEDKTSIAFNKIKARPQIEPAQPEGLSAKPIRHAVQLNWDGNNTELDFNHYEIIRDGVFLPDHIPDTFYIDDDPSLENIFHDYYVLAVDNDGYVSDTAGGRITTKAAALEADQILAVNRSSIGVSAYVDEEETGRFMREALSNHEFVYVSDTIHTNPATSIDLSVMVDYGLMVIGAESARSDDIGNFPSLGGILDSIAYYLSIGGKVIIFGRWGDISTAQGVDEIYYEPDLPGHFYTDYFNIAYRVIPRTIFYGVEFYSDFVGAKSQVAGYPDLDWDSMLTIQHSLPRLEQGFGIPAPSLPVFTGAKVETLYTYVSAVDSELTHNHPIAWHYDGANYEYIFFEIPLSFMKRDAALAALRQAVDDLMEPTAADEGDDMEQIPSTFSLAQNYPNPFNPRTSIEFYNPLSLPADVTLEIFNILGQRVKILFDGKALPGVNKIEWAGRNEDNRPVASGIYFYRLKTAEMSLTRKMVLLK